MKQNLFSVAVLLLLLLYTACKNKSRSNDEEVISALSIIKGQLNHLDTSLYQVTKYETTNEKTDTAWLKREQVREFAAPFISLPDISEDKYRDQYTEERLIDAGQEQLSITYTANKENAEILKQIFIIKLEDISGGNVHSIYIDRFIQNKDSSVQQKLYWEIDKHFSVGNIIQKNNAPETTHQLKVEWK
jgi:hypothetical protein